MPLNHKKLNKREKRQLQWILLKMFSQLEAGIDLEKQFTQCLSVGGVKDMVISSSPYKSQKAETLYSRNTGTGWPQVVEYRA